MSKLSKGQSANTTPKRVVRYWQFFSSLQNVLPLSGLSHKTPISENVIIWCPPEKEKTYFEVNKKTANTYHAGQIVLGQWNHDFHLVQREISTCLTFNVSIIYSCNGQNVMHN